MGVHRRRLASLFALAALLLGGCESVKFYQRERLGSPIMRVRGPAGDFAAGKIETSREGASGASGASAGGGCGCY